MYTSHIVLQRKRYLSGILMAGLGSILFSGKAILIKLAFTYGANAEILLALYFGPSIGGNRVKKK